MAVAPIGIAVLIGLVAGLVRRGRFASLARTRLRAVSLLAVAVACGALVDATSVPIPGVWAGVGLVAGVAFALRNAHVVGMAIIGVGVALNLLPVVVNGTMPVRADALVEAGMVDSADLDRVSLDGAREIAGPETRLDSLGDVIPIRLTAQVLSFGDLIMLVGLADVIANLMLQRRPRRLPQGAAPTLVHFGWREAPAREGGLIDLTGPVGAQPPAITSARPVHDWGTAPPAAPVSGSQYSARPEIAAPSMVPRRIASDAVAVDVAVDVAADAVAVDVAADERPVATQSR